MKTIFFRALEAEDKAMALRAAIHEPNGTGGKRRFEVDAESFGAVPHSPFAYWVSERLSRLFKRFPSFDAEGRSAKQGLATADDFRFVRSWWALRPQYAEERWFPFAKGGTFSPFYADVFLSLNWRAEGHELKAWAGSLYNSSHWSRILKNTDFFLRPGLTWPRRTQGGLSLRAMPAGCIFADKGPAAFVEADDTVVLLALLAIVNAKAFCALVDIQMAFGSYEVGVIQRTPIPHLDPAAQSILTQLSRRAWALKRSLDTRTETSHAFIRPALLVTDGDTIAARANAVAKRIARTESEIFGIQDEIDLRCFKLYGIDESDKRAITQGFGANADELAEDGAGQDSAADADAEPDEDGDTGGTPDAVGLAAELVSWAIGVAFGRFDIRLATGARPLPPEPEPFDPLPLCSPAMLTGSDGLPLRSPPVGYPVVFPENGILVDDRGHARDLTAVVRGVFDEVFNASVEAWWIEVGALLDPKDHDLRAWIASSFFEHHLKRHSKSRRKAPILWQLAIPSGRYSIWLYAHRLTRDTFFQIQNEVVTPKLVHEERQLTSLTQSMGAYPSAKDRKEIAAQEVFVQELRGLLGEVKCVAPLWNPLLDDGAMLTMAPLWRLAPQHKAWQKELKSKWEELAAGKYDWAHLAMHLWPERVVPKCTADRSLAIAHGLEDVFWVEGLSGHWQQRVSIADTVRYLEENLYSDRMRQTIEELVAFSQAHATTNGAGPGWWTVLSMGGSDDLALALALWPERVLRKAVADPTRFTDLGIKLPRARTGEDLLAMLLNTYRPRLLAHELQTLGEFCSYPGGRDIWSQRWVEFAAGVHDEYGLARTVHTPRIVAKAQADPDVARLHDLYRWFWLLEDSGSRQLKEPPDEIADAVRVRTSVAVKASLKSMLEAPGVAPGRGSGRSRQATSTAADGETV